MDQVYADYRAAVEAEQDLCPLDGLRLIPHPLTGELYCPDYLYHAGN